AHSNPSHFTSSLMASTNSCSSLIGFVSSKRKLTGALYFIPNPKFRQIEEAWPICKYPLGSGGNLKDKSVLSYFSFKSSSIICSRKFKGADSFFIGVNNGCKFTENYT